MPMTHRRAVGMMVAAALMWSIAGVVTRHLEAARSFEVTFWRSAFNAVALVLLLCALRGPRGLIGFSNEFMNLTRGTGLISNIFDGYEAY